MYLTTKLRKLNYLFFYLKQYFSTSHLTRLYLTLYQPVISYAIIFWEGAAEYHMDPIEMLQKRLLKSISSDRSSCTVGKRLLNIKQLYELHLLDFVFKNYNRFDISPAIGITRGALGDQAKWPRYFKYHTRIQAPYMGVKIFNALSFVIKMDIKNFKRRRKAIINYLLSK